MAEPDDEKTVIPGRPASGSRQAWAPPPPDTDEPHTLPVGTRLDEFEIQAIIGTGGFGIVYKAHDHSLGRDVALKEYLPSSLAYRRGLQVSVKTRRDADTFSAGLSSFINEARVLAHFDNPSLVKVYRFWSANGTAYMVMPYYEGPTLKQRLAEATAAPSEEWLRGLLSPLLSALQLLHSENYYHRDIAPDNILLVRGERPILLDFGAARRVIAGSDQALTVILKPGYAPVEQYSEADMAQGAWTDLYAVAAVLHYAILGKPPVPSLSRLIKDTAIPLAQAAAGRYSDAFLRALDKALSVRPEDRPQSTDEFARLLGLEIRPAHALTRREQPAGPTTATPATPAPSSRKRLAIGAAAGVAVLALAVAGLWSPREPVATASKAGAPAPTAPVVPAPSTPPAPPDQPLPPSVVSAPPAPAPAPAPVPVLPARFDPAEALAQVHALRDPDFDVRVVLDKTTVRVGRDRLRFQVQAGREGYLYILMLGTDGQHISLLFPNALDPNNQMKAGQPLNLPRPGWAMTAAGPPGINDFVALVSEQPRNFASLGLTKVGPFSEFSLERLASLSRAGTGTAVLAGAPVCGKSGPCSAAYGAARFQIEEIK